MLDEVPELLSILEGSVGGSNVYSVLEVLSSTPCSRLHTSVLPLIVYQPVLEDGVTGTHDIVEEDTGLDNEPHSVSMMAHGGEKNLKAVSNDAKRILNHSPGPVEPVVEDPLLPVQVPGTVWLHQVGPQGEGIVPHQEVGYILVVVGEGIRTWPTNNVIILQPSSQFTVVVDVGI